MDQELKDRLHDAQVCSPAQNYCRNRHVMEEAANRIEVLEEKLKVTVDDAKEAEDYAEELEAKLAKAVEALEWVKFGGGPTGESYHLNAVDTLAELTGGQSGSKT